MFYFELGIEPQQFIMFCYALLMLNKGRRPGAFVLFLQFSVFYLVLSKLPDIYYYVSCATLSLFVGCLLLKNYTIPAMLSFTLILVNYYGFSIWYDYQPPDNYDNLSIIILFIQLFFMLPKGLLNYVGTFARFNKYPLVRSADFNSRKLCAKMRKNNSQE